MSALPSSKLMFCAACTFLRLFCRYAKDVRYFSQTGSVSKVPYTSIMGTQGYIAPEILAKQHYGTEIDMWAAGIMCFVMLGGYKPFNPPSACLSCKTGLSCPT